MFDPKLAEKSSITPPEYNEKAPNQNGTHTTRTELPPGLTVEKMQKCTTAEIDALIKEFGAGIGYANMIKLASGHGKTPAGTQYLCCAFLLNRAQELEDQAQQNASVAAKLRNLPTDKLYKLIAQLEEQEQLAPPIDVELVHETPENDQPETRSQ